MEFVLFDIGTTFALLLGFAWNDLARSKPTPCLISSPEERS
jgi:hypothetical protein